MAFVLGLTSGASSFDHLQASLRGDGKSSAMPQKPCSKAAAPTPPKRRNSTLWSEMLDIHQKGTFSTQEIKRQEVRICTKSWMFIMYRHVNPEVQLDHNRRTCCKWQLWIKAESLVSHVSVVFVWSFLNMAKCHRRLSSYALDEPANKWSTALQFSLSSVCQAR